MLFALAASVLCSHAAAIAPPATDKRPVTDDYRWLEDWNDASVKAWSEAQNVYARAHLDALPERAAIEARVKQIMTAPSVRHYSLARAGKRLLAIRRESGKQQPMLVAFDDAAAVLAGGGGSGSIAPRVLLDPAAMTDAKGATIDWYEPSPDGELIAVSISLAGSEAGDVRILNAADGKQIGEIVPRVNGGTAGGSMAWAPDSKSFYYSRYPRAGERPEDDLAFYTQVYFHALGTDSKDDRYEVGKDFPKIAEIVLECDERTGIALASVQNGDGGEFIHLLRDAATGRWTQIDTYEDRVVQAVLGPDRALYMVSRKDAPRGRLLRLALPENGEPRLADAAVIVPEQSDTLVSEFFEAANLLVTERFIYAMYQLGGPSEVRVFDHDGRPAPKPNQPPVAAAGGLAHMGGEMVAFNITSFVQPTGWYAGGIDKDGKPAVLALTSLSTSSPVDFSAYTCTREMATSKDGTKVPVNIIHKRGFAVDKSRPPSPCLVTGYGGYGVNIDPDFRAQSMALLEQGFVLAVANIRGGGEFGEAWHLGGNLKNKQNVFDDFAAACGHLIERGYTSSDKLAIEGGSNGGLLMGAILTQHPRLAAAVVSHVGIYDMLRVELSSNGAFNIPEFGTVKDKGLFEALFAYSPYHRVKDGTAYPATLFMTGANDPRVDPMQSRKMAARLQAATSASNSDAPILLRTSGDTGHGAGTPMTERIAQTADGHSFLMHQLKVDYKPVEK